MKLLLRIFTTINLLFVIYPAFSASVSEKLDNKVEIEFPAIIVKHVEQDITIQITDRELSKALEGSELMVNLNGNPIRAEVVFGKLTVSYDFPEQETLELSIGDYSMTRDVNPIPLWLSILPPLIAIFFALLLREVYSALIAGIWIGTGVIYFYQGSSFFPAIFKGFLAIIDTYIIQSLNNSGHLSIILFSLIIAGTVSLITKNGGMGGVVNSLSEYARGPRSGSLITWLLGIMIFFDDYANTLVVGNTMRPLTDKLRISREKLSYIIDSTAAPVASIAFVTTWIGAELSYIQDGINSLNLDESAYGVFFGSLAYSFYPFFTLAFIFILVWKGKDFGPMLKAEARARQQIPSKVFVPDNEAGEAEAESSGDRKPKQRILNAVIPVLVIVLGTMAGLVYTGWDQSVWDNPEMSFFEKLSDNIGAADSYVSLLWASSGSLFVALFLTLSQRLLGLRAAMDAIVSGFKTMLPAVMIMTLAWSVALVTKHMHTADFISNLLLDAAVSPFLLPSITFVMAALVSFSTGSSWGTMAILYPLILPSSWLVAQNYGLEYDASMAIFHNIAAAVLTGSVLGDHCSPISDTTILSSLASSCPHIEHVRTQLPYALTTGLLAIFIGSLPAAYGVSPWILYPLGLGMIYLIIHFLGKQSETYTVA
jgi:Na+/H+ antiporter NhaC